MKKRMFFYVLFLTLVYYTCYGQERGCLMDSTNLSSLLFRTESLTTSCGDINDYSPLNPSQSPIIKVLIDFHIFQKDDGTGNFTVNDTSIIKGFVNKINQRLANMDNLNVGTSPYIKDSKIRVKLMGIYFHQNTSDWDYNAGSTSAGNYIMNKYIINDYDNYGFSEADKYHVEHFLLPGGYNILGGLTSAIGKQGFITEKAVEYKFNSDGSHMIIGNMVHELGHAFGLRHSFYCVDNCTDNDPSTSDCSDSLHDPSATNNYMDYWPSGYSAWNPGLSQCQLSRARYYLMGNAGTIYKTVANDYCNFDSSQTIEIKNGNYVWNDHKRLQGNLIVDSGSKLTIKCVVSLPSEGKVVVKQGGKLIIDGGLLTNECGSYWKGVEVWGTTNKHQYPESHPTYQGMLVLQNGGTIENAHNGVTNWHPDYWDEIGGVIVSKGGRFINNRRDVEFMAYQNFYPGYPNYEMYDFSYFRNTDFISDSNFIEKYLSVKPHVTLWKVNRIKFVNCHFENKIAEYNTAPHTGIYSLDAGYIISPSCGTPPPVPIQVSWRCPPVFLLPSKFIGLTRAIEASGTGTSNTIYVGQSVFKENHMGIEINELDNVSINRNKIQVCGNVPSLLGIGIEIKNSTGYMVEENEITTLLDPNSGFYCGIYIVNSGVENNRLYKNKLTHLTAGTFITRLNRNSNNPNEGLQVLCNEFTNNNTATHIATNTAGDGIRYYQGGTSPEKPAGNTFSGNIVDIQNEGFPILYIHNGGNTKPINYSTGVALYQVTNANACPSSFTPWDIIISYPVAKQPATITNRLETLHNNWDSLKTIYTSLQYNYLSLLDAGNTKLLKSEIETNWSNDAWLMRNNLMEKSPYLSSAVILKAAAQNVMPNAMLLEIILANPDATRFPSFLKKLDKTTNHTFPKNRKQLIKNNRDKRTIRTELEGQMAATKVELANTKHRIRLVTLSKNKYTYQERLSALNLGNTIADKVGVMDFFVSHHQWTKADSVLLVIKNDKQLDVHSKWMGDYGKYINFRASLGNKNIAQLDSSEIVQLKTIADGKGRAAGYAQNILCFFYHICDEDTLQINQGVFIPHSKAQNNQSATNLFYKISFYPNPADDQLNLSWTVYDELDNCQYKIISLKNGEAIAAGNITQNTGTKTINLRDTQSGYYVVKIINEGKVRVEKKVVIE